MNSKRIIAIASLIDKNASVIDIGTDHAYLPIYLINNNITSKVDSSDISKEVLKQSRANIEKYLLDNIIHLFQSDGFKNIKNTYDIAVICGMGTKTILDILDYKNIPNTLILQSNHEIPLLRKSLCSKGYMIDKELYIEENNKYYVIFKYIKENEKLDELQIEYGKYPNKDYLLYELKKIKKSYSKNNNDNILNKIKNLEQFIEKIPD